MSFNEPVPAFNLPTASNNFANRSQDVFASLQTLEDKHSAYQRHRESSGKVKEDENLWKKEPDEDLTTAYRKQENTFRKDSETSVDDSSFKQPTAPRPRKFGRFVPDFKKHPEKWTKYSLEDVDASDMSERANTQAAFSFLEERRLLREKSMEDERDDTKLRDGACSKGKISFSKPTKDKTEDAKLMDTFEAKKMHSSANPSEFNLSYLNQCAANEDIVKEETDAVERKEEKDSSTFVSFKGRKTFKRSIRSRDLDDGTDDD